MPHVRPYRSADRAAVFDICVRTADAGGDSRETYPDPELMPSIFAAPYLHLEPDSRSSSTTAGDGPSAMCWAPPTRRGS
jgi:hypothetical protein